MFFIAVAGTVRVRQVSHGSSSQSHNKGILHRSQPPEGPSAKALRIHRYLSQRTSEILSHSDFYSTPLQGHLIQSFSSNIVIVILLLLHSYVIVVVAF